MLRCDACGLWTTERHSHHVLPLALGGLDEPTNVVEICTDCHGKLHELPHRFLNHRELTKAGLAAARARGTRLGAVRKLSPAQAAKARELRQGGWSIKALSRKYSVSEPTMSRLLRRTD